MRQVLAILASSTMLIFPPAAADTSVDAAIEASHASVSDSLETKVVLLLHLLNDEGYLYESCPDPIMKNSARFRTTPKEKAEQLVANYRKNSSGTYDLDSNRTPEEMLNQRIGGSCGTEARVFAYLLEKLGVPSRDLRIVSAVCTEEYVKMCPLGHGSKLNKNYHGGASGHVFVLLRDDQIWRLINTTFSPFDEKNGPHVKEIKAVRDHLHQKFTDKKAEEAARADALSVIRKLKFNDIESAIFDSATALEKKLSAGEVVKAPIFESLPETLPGENGPLHLRNMLIYESVMPKQFKQHAWRDRYPIIASGAKNNNICRFTYSAGK